MERTQGMKPLGHPWVPVARKTSKLAMLLAAYILSSCCPLSQAQKEVKVKVEPAKPSQGQRVIFTPEVKDPPSLRRCCWYKETFTEESMITCMTPGNPHIKGGSPPSQTHGLAYNQWMKLDSMCILHITNVQLNDTGIYRVQITRTRVQDTGTASLEVIGPVGKKQANNKEDVSTTRIAFPSTTLQSPLNTERKGSAIWIIMCLVLILALAATIVYFVFRVRRLRSMMTPAQTAPLDYENLPPSKQDKPQSTNEANNIYQSILPGHQGEYDQLSWKQSNPPAAGLRI